MGNLKIWIFGNIIDNSDSLKLPETLRKAFWVVDAVAWQGFVPCPPTPPTPEIIFRVSKLRKLGKPQTA